MRGISCRPGRTAADNVGVVGLVVFALAGSAAASPLVFEQNAGQHDGRTKFVARAHGAAVFLTDDGAVFSLQRGRVRIGFRLELPGSRHASPEALEPLVERHHWFKGTREHWRTNVPTFARARYASAWPGVDVELHGESGALELDLRLAPHANLEAARLAFTGATVRAVHADSIELEVAGEKVTLGAPLARQGSRTVDCHYRRRGAAVGFELGPRDDAREVLIDPVMTTWSGFLGGTDDDSADSVAVAVDGDALVTGVTSSADFPFLLGQRMYSGAHDAFVTRLNPVSGTVAWTTFLGGAADDSASGIALEPGGEVDVVGTTLSANFPSTVPSRAYDGGPSSEAFVVRLSPQGDAVLFASTLGGSGIDLGAAVATDATSIWVAGSTRSGSFSGGTPVPYLNKLGGQDAFVAQLLPDAGMAFFTWFGGEGTETVTTLKLDALGRLYLAGKTTSKNQLPLIHPVQDAGNDAGNNEDGFLAIIDPETPATLFSSYFGGPGNDSITSLALRADGDFYVGGTAYDTQDWLPPTARLNPRTGGGDGFLARFGLLGGSLKWVGVVGGGDVDGVNGVAADPRGNLLFAANAGTSNLKGTPGAIQSSGAGKSDGLFGLVDPDGNQFVYLSFLGGSLSDSFHDLALIDGGMVLVGSSTSGDFPTAGTSFHGDGGTSDAVVVSVFIPAPRVSVWSPDAGPIDGGTQVEITGDYFFPDASVTFAGNAATVVQALGQTQLTVLTPPGPPGVADVVVTNADGQSTTLSGAFTYVGNLPPVAVISPPSQTVDPGANAALDGSGSAGVAPLSFGWEQSAGPTAGQLTVNGATVQFQSQVAGDYAFKLTVTDGTGAMASASATLKVTGSAPPVPPFKPGCGCSGFDAPMLMLALLLLEGEGAAKRRMRARAKSTR